MTSESKRSRARVLGRVVGFVVALTAVFVVALGIAVVVHLGLPASRRVVTAQLNGLMKEAFAGELWIEHIGGLGLRGIDRARIRVRDPEGVLVIRADGVQVGLRALEAIQSALRTKEPLVIALPSISIADGEVNLDPDASGELRIVRAFEPRTPAEPKKLEDYTTREPVRPIHVVAPSIRLAHVWVHGAPPDTPLIDADLSEVHGSSYVEPTAEPWSADPRVLASPPVVRIEISRARLVARALPRGLDPKGNLAGTLAVPAPNGHGIELRSTFDGELGGVASTVEFRMNDRHVDARVDANDPAGARRRAFVSEAAVREPLSFHAEADGDLPYIEGQAKLMLGEATLDANAVVEASTTTRVKGAVTARNVDASALVAAAPPTLLGFDAHANVTIEGNVLRGEGALETLPGIIDEQAVPRASVRASFTDGAAHLRAWTTDATIPTEIVIDVSRREDRESGQLVVAHARTRVPDLRRVPKLGKSVGGSAAAEASARLLFPEGAIEDARVSIALGNVDGSLQRDRGRRLSLGTLDATARVRGTFDEPAIDAVVAGSNLVFGKVQLASMAARGRIALADDRIDIVSPMLEAVRDATHRVSASARVVHIDKSALRVHEARILGLGAPILVDLTRDRRGIRGRVDAPRIDLPVAACLAGETEVSHGTLGIRGEGVLDRGVLKAKAHAELQGLITRSGSVDGARALVDAAVDGPELSLALNAVIGTVGTIDLRTEAVTLGGRIDDIDGWRRADGGVRLSAEMDMARVLALVPAGTLPLVDLNGTLSIRGRFGRDFAEAAPEVQIHAHTRDLVAAGRARTPEYVQGIEVEAPPVWRSSGVDIGVDLRTDGPSGLFSASVRATDRSGLVGAFDAKARLPYAAMIADQSKIRELVLDAPMTARMILPPRRIDQVPLLGGLRDLQGAVDGQLDASGSLRDPRVQFVAHTHGARSTSMPPDIEADADLTVDYDGRAAHLVAKVSSRGAPLLDVASHVEIRARDVITASGGSGSLRTPLPWRASARARLASFPLESVPQLVDRRIRGRVSGELLLDGLHENARGSGSIDLSGLSVGNARYPRGRFTVEALAGILDAKVHLEQPDGFLDASAKGKLGWGAETFPRLDTQEPIVASVVARGFRAAAIQPFVEDLLPALDGRIDADATASIGAGAPGAVLRGHVTFRDGTVQVAALGEELRTVRASATFSPDGRIHVTDVSARGTQGELFADGDVKLAGARIAEATANLRIPQRRPLSVVIEGEPVGALSGNLRVTARSTDENTTSVVVEVPRLEAELPLVTKGSVQSLDEKRNIRVGVYRDQHRFVRLPLSKEDLEPPRKETGGERIEVDMHLGRITLTRGNQLRVDLTGNPNVTFEGGETSLVGQVRVEGGWVEVQGRRFEIEKGLITFGGESPPNPIVVATAGWTAGDGSRVFADFAGPVETGKVTLHSEPPRPNSEILSLILFGTADVVSAQPVAGRRPDGTTRAAFGLGGAFVAQGLTAALDELAGIRATARIETTRANNPRPEVEVQLSPKVSLGFAHVIGTPPITEPDKNLASIEYRFHRNWSLETTFGDRGTALLDAIWQKRY
jgi:translocation and assembly module TamB